MSERDVAIVVDRLLGDGPCHLTEGVVCEIAGRLLSSSPPRAVVIGLDGIRTSAWGVRRQFQYLGPIEVYA